MSGALLRAGADVTAGAAARAGVGEGERARMAADCAAALDTLQPRAKV